MSVYCVLTCTCGWSLTGKSLDKIMELKQLAGDRDLYDVMRRQRRRQKVIDARAAKGYTSDKTQPHSQSSGYVFDFINHKLGPHRTGKCSSVSQNPLPQWGCWGGYWDQGFTTKGYSWDNLTWTHSQSSAYVFDFSSVSVEAKLSFVEPAEDLFTFCKSMMS